MRGRWLALGAALCLLLAACAPEEGPGPAPDPSPSPSQTAAPAPEVRREFTLPLDPAGTWDPYAGSKSSNMTLAPLVYESLFQLDNSFEPQPLLAREATVSEDGLTWTIALKSGVTFSDGTPLTCEEVRAALDAARRGESVYAARLSCIRELAEDGPDRVRIVLREPNARLPALLDVPIARVTKGGVYGTGPYAVEGDRLSARRDWWGSGGEALADIPLLEVENADALVAAFDAGELSLVAADPTGADALGYAGSHQIWEYPTTTMLYLGFQRGKGPCREEGFRRAVTLALDRPQLVNQVLKGHASVAALPLPPTAQGYDRALAGELDHDADAAAQALEELGYQAGEDGVLGKGRTALDLTLLVNSDNAYKEALAQSISESLTELGVQVTLQALPWEEYKKALAAGRFDLYLGECRLTGDMDVSAFFTAGSGLCYGGSASKELSGALAGAKATGEWGEFYALWVRENPLAVLCFKTGSMLTQWGQVTGAQPTQGDLFYQFENWRLG